jgi:hypothetical protein
VPILDASVSVSGACVNTSLDSHCIVEVGKIRQGTWATIGDFHNTSLPTVVSGLLFVHRWRGRGNVDLVLVNRKSSISSAKL